MEGWRRVLYLVITPWSELLAESRAALEVGSRASQLVSNNAVSSDVGL